MDTAAAARRRRIQRSILDTVIGEYQHLTGEASFLGAASKRKLDLHLQSIREIERELAPADDVIDGGSGANAPIQTCAAPPAPADPDIPDQNAGGNPVDYDKFTYGTGDGAPKVQIADVERVFHLHAELYALALRCDLVRYGNLMFESAGGHTNLEGTYSAMGQSTTFPGTSQHDEYFHGNKLEEARLYQHFAQSNLAYFIGLLDDAEYLEQNGKTLLDNTSVVIGTEYGWNHDKNGAFHAVIGGGRFKPGNYTSQRLNCIDLYNAILLAHGLPATVGSATDVESEGDASGAIV